MPTGTRPSKAKTRRETIETRKFLLDFSKKNDFTALFFLLLPEGHWRKPSCQLGKSAKWGGCGPFQRIDSRNDGPLCRFSLFLSFFFKVFFFLQILCVPFFFSSSSLAPRGFPAEWGTRRTEIKKPSNWPIVLRRRRRLSLPRFTEFLPSFPVSLGHRCAFTRMNECST